MGQKVNPIGFRLAVSNRRLNQCSDETLERRGALLMKLFDGVPNGFSDAGFCRHSNTCIGRSG